MNVLDDRQIINFQNWKKIDPILFSLLIALTSTGLIMLYSAGGGNFSPWAFSQVKRIIVFLPIMYLTICINPKIIFKFSYVVFIVGILLLLYANFAGFSALGAKRWVKILFFNLQPSEFMKIALIMGLARYYHSLHIYKVNNIYHLAIPLLMILIPVYLIIKQPDLGTSLILLGTGIIILFVSGVGIGKFIASGLTAIFAIPFLWSFLKPYQQQRVLTFLNPDLDPLGSGYNIIQSKIAIGSGGFLGKGFMEGSQGQLNFLPERETDFIFTMLAEEFGFLGSAITITLFTLTFIRCINIALHTKYYYGKLLVIGLSSFLFLHFFINIAMVTGIIPVVGAPLPLISYGGTMLIITLFSFALISNIDINKDYSVDK
jgi:rod shape determining protein RodA